MKGNPVAFEGRRLAPYPLPSAPARLLGAFLALLLGCLMAAVFPTPARCRTPAPPVAVAASIIPLGDFCRQIGGDRVAVQVLTPPGASPHVFEPPPSVVARAMAARVLVCVGAGLDPWAERLRTSRGTQDLVVVEAAAGVPLIQEVHSEDHDHGPGHRHEKKKESPGKGHGHIHAQGNPHVWLDPVLVQDLCRRIAQAFIQVDPEHRSVYEANLSRYLAELEALHQEIAGRTAAFRLKAYVSFHPAFAYFARRYGLQEVGVIESAPGREPTPRHIQRLVAAIRRHQVRVVFAEPQLSHRVAEAIAREAGVRVLVLDPLGGFPPYGEDYLKLMRHNLTVMAEAMQ